VVPLKGKKKIQFGVVEKNYAALIAFLSLGRVGRKNYIRHKIWQLCPKKG
jgi:hypothetical protein